MSARPIQVYLDSQDYSRLSEPSLGAELRSVLDYLIQKSNERSIDVRLSLPHVMEGIAVDPRNFVYAKRRLQLMKALSHGRCLVDTFSLLRLEGANVECLDLSESVLRDDGVWFPGLHSIDMELPSLTDIFLENETFRAANRQTRRRIKAEMLRPDGRLTPKGQDT